MEAGRNSEDGGKVQLHPGVYTTSEKERKNARWLDQSEWNLRLSKKLDGPGLTSLFFLLLSTFGVVVWRIPFLEMRALEVHRTRVLGMYDVPYDTLLLTIILTSLLIIIIIIIILSLLFW